MSDEEFFALLVACREELSGKQTLFQHRIDGGNRWFYDLANCTLTIDDERLDITPIGTFSPKYQSWLWAWANEDFPATAREKSEQLKTLHSITGFHAFVTPGVPASVEDANDFVALSVHHLGGMGFFRVPSKDAELPTLFLSINNGESAE